MRRLQTNIISLLVLAACACLTTGAAQADGPLHFSDSTASAGFKAPVQIRDGSILAVRTEGTSMKCFRSTDLGKSWQERGIVATDDTPGTDIGDGHLMTLRNGDLLYSYRDNHIHGRQTGSKQFSIKVATSRDGGKSWQHHSTVAAAKATDFGLWSSYLLQKQDGTLQCYYDDERSPSLAGLPRHQWITMKTWNPAKGVWENPVTVSRATGTKLSRDGMCTMIETSPEHLLCACEGVQEAPPHRGCLWMSRSSDGGKTWTESHIPLYEPKNDFNALAPWMVRLGSGTLVMVFTTDEGHDKPADASTGVLSQDLKYMTSADDGVTWAGPWLVDGAYPIYFPGACMISDKTGVEAMLVQYSGKDGLRCRIGWPNK